MSKLNKSMGKCCIVVATLMFGLIVPAWASMPSDSLGAFASTSDTSAGLLDDVCLEGDCSAYDGSDWVDNGNACVFEPLDSDTSFMNLQSLPTGSSIFLTNADGKVITIDGMPLSANEVGKDPRYTIHETPDGMVQITDNEKGICFNPHDVVLKDREEVSIVTKTYEEATAGEVGDELLGASSSFPLDLTFGDPETKTTGDYDQCKRAGLNGDLAPTASESCVDGYNAGVLKSGRDDFIPKECGPGFVGPLPQGESERCQSMFVQEPIAITKRDELPSKDEETDLQESKEPEEKGSDEQEVEAVDTQDDAQEEAALEDDETLKSDTIEAEEALGEPMERIETIDEISEDEGLSSNSIDVTDSEQSIEVPEGNGIEEDDNKEPESRMAGNSFYDPTADDDEISYGDEEDDFLDQETLDDGDDFFSDLKPVEEKAQNSELEDVNTRGVDDLPDGQRPNPDSIETQALKGESEVVSLELLNQDLKLAEAEVELLKDEKGIFRPKKNSKGQVVMGLVVEIEQDPSTDQISESNNLEQLREKFGLSDEELAEQIGPCLKALKAQQVKSLERCLEENPKIGRAHV